MSVTDPAGHDRVREYDKIGALAYHGPAWGGHGTAYDADQRVIATYDPAGRQLSQTDPDGLAVEHELVFDRRGLLTSRTRGSQGMSWEYDGNRTEFTDSLNSTT